MRSSEGNMAFLEAGVLLLPVANPALAMLAASGCDISGRGAQVLEASLEIPCCEHCELDCLMLNTRRMHCVRCWRCLRLLCASNSLYPSGPFQISETEAALRDYLIGVDKAA